MASISWGSWKNSRHLQSQSLHSVNSIKSFDFSTLYNTIPHDILKSKLKELIKHCVFHKNGNRRLQYVVLGFSDTYLVQDHSDEPHKYSDVIKLLEYLSCTAKIRIKMLEYLIVEFGRRIFSTNNRHPYGYWLCAITCRLVFILVWGGLCTKKKKKNQ